MNRTKNSDAKPTWLTARGAIAKRIFGLFAALCFLAWAGCAALSQGPESNLKQQLFEAVAQVEAKLSAQIGDNAARDVNNNGDTVGSWLGILSGPVCTLAYIVLWRPVRRIYENHQGIKPQSTEAKS